jgi:hypothetical protein
VLAETLICPATINFASSYTAAVSTMRDIARGRGPAFDDVDTTRVLARGPARLHWAHWSDRFCIGGGFAVVAGHEVEASSVNYGALPKTPRAGSEMLARCWRATVSVTDRLAMRPSG